MEKRSVRFNLPTGSNNRIRLSCLHPKKPWVAIITNNNTFSLWNYAQSILIKSFNCSTLDDSSTVDVREIIFYDKHSLVSASQQLSQMKSNIIFATNLKIFFYDYVTDCIRQINESDVEKKNIKKICPFSATQICVGLNDGSIKLYDNKEGLKESSSMTFKLIRGYHSRPITNLFAYCPNENETPRLISVSGSDGLMACWNVETLLGSHANLSAPCFKFERPGNQPRNEEIRSFQYDRESYKILTVTENYISIWSTMTGRELKRIKNQHRFRELYFFSHFSYGANSFLALGEVATSVYVVKMDSGDRLVLADEINLKSLIKEHSDVQIEHMHCEPDSPCFLFLQTVSGFVALEVDRSYRGAFGFHNSFVTKLSTINSKEFVNRKEMTFAADVSPERVRSMKFEADILFNSFYLSADSEWVYFNLLEVQIQNVLHEKRTFKFLKLEPESVIASSNGSQNTVQVSFDGNSFFVFNRHLSYFEVYCLQRSDFGSQNLLEASQEISKTIDFYSKFDLKRKGLARDIVWHQYKDQFVCICGFDKNENIVTFQSPQKQKKGIFGGSKSQKPPEKLTADVANWCACIFEMNLSSEQYEVIEKSKPIKSQICRIFNLGSMYGYSSQEKGASELMECFSEDHSMVSEVEGVSFFPLKVFVSYCQSFQIYAYESYFLVFRMQENGYMGYHCTVHEKLEEGFFWEKFFFFSTKNELYFMQITLRNKLFLRIGEANPLSIFGKSSNEPSSSGYIDDLEEEVFKMPSGQLQFLTVANGHLVILNQIEEVTLFPLKNPYVEFCIEIVCGSTERMAQIYRRCCPPIQLLMKQSLEQYGLMLPSIQKSEPLIF